MTAHQRRPFVAGNWKMNLDRTQAVALARTVAADAKPLGEEVDLAVCPPFVYLDAVASTIAESEVFLGAQDVYFEPNGAFTGETSCEMLKDVSVQYVLAGHSERRHIVGETDDLVARKTKAVLQAGLRCILCVGETLDQREAGQTDDVNRRQINTAFEALDNAQIQADPGILTIAYEPVWAIGTGKTATPADAQDAHAKIRSLLSELLGHETAQEIRTLYGGSVKPENAAELFAQRDIDGGLIGGASLKAEDFLAIAAAAVPSAAPGVRG